MTKPKLSYAIDEAAEAIGMSERFLRREIWAGRLDAAKLGSRVVIFAEALHSMLEQGRRKLISESK